MRLARAAAVLAGTALLASCSSATSSAPPNQSPPSINVSVAPLEPALHVTDPHGQEITLPAAPERIVCLTGLCDDALAELGVKPAGTSSPTLLTHPALLGAAGAGVAVVPGTFGSEDVEAVAGMRPDLVIGLEGVHDALRPAITRFAPLWTVGPKDWQESVGYLRALGALTGRTQQAADAERRFRQKLADAVRTSRERGLRDRTVLVMYGSADSISVDTADSLTGRLLGELFGYPWPARGTDADTASTYSVEEILAKQPDVVFVYSLLFSPTDKKLSEQLADNPVWGQVKAVQHGNVHETHAKLWGAGRGTRSLGAIVDEALDKVAAAR
ncbi:iron siderophore-binding protein [Longimycelium tulufanense]|uniref:Iron siderophore-binding protein n=1 Tax=Longimycelium tulufanense TaxID=907463 RepID=A0A8J3CCB7_9PSEU|nr:ABC transporter substrate-binding protein [Longimycelium tulufanense]GGM58108.1 iron siderophore-binding protein [Longimycelium tulufanense]